MIMLIYLFSTFSRLFSNHHTACGKVPLNMLSLTPHTNALCYYDDFSLPPLIKCFAKLSEKSFRFYSQKIQREEDREKTMLWGCPALRSLPASYPNPHTSNNGFESAHGSFPVWTHIESPSLVISASNGKKLLQDSNPDDSTPEWGSCHTWDDYTYYICLVLACSLLYTWDQRESSSSMTSIWIHS